MDSQLRMKWYSIWIMKMFVMLFRLRDYITRSF